MRSGLCSDPRLTVTRAERVSGTRKVEFFQRTSYSHRGGRRRRGKDGFLQSVYLAAVDDEDVALAAIGGRVDWFPVDVFSARHLADLFEALAAPLFVIIILLERVLGGECARVLS